MDLRKVRNFVKLTNKVGGYVVSNAFSLAPEGFGEHVRTVDTRRLPEKVLEDLQKHFEAGNIDAELASEGKKATSNKDVEQVITANGEDSIHEHTVFKPSDKAINVEEITTSTKAVEVGFSKLDAVEILEKHWKTLEKEVEKITDLDKLNLLLSTALELDMKGNKKCSLIEDRISKLS